MGAVTLPALVVLPRYWLAESRGLSHRWLDEWLPWQFCGVSLPVALHRTCIHSGSEFAQDYGELGVYLVRLTEAQFDAMAAHVSGGNLPVELFNGCRIPTELVYDNRGGLDPADALSLVFVGDAIRAELRGDQTTAAACGVGSSLAGMVSGAVASGAPGAGGSSFTSVCESLVAVDRHLQPEDFPERLSDVAAFLDDCRRKWPESFK